MPKDSHLRWKTLRIKKRAILGQISRVLFLSSHDLTAVETAVATAVKTAVETAVETAVSPAVATAVQTAWNKIEQEYPS